MAVGDVLVVDEVSPRLLEVLVRAGVEVEYRPGAGRGELLRLVPGFRVLIVRGRTRVDREVLEAGASGRLRAVVRAGIGLDNIDLEAARRLGVEVYNTPGAPVESVAELTVGLMIAAARRIVELNLAAREGRWVKGYGVELWGKTLLILGLGRIGSRVAEIARVLGMRVKAYDYPEVLEARRGLAEPVYDLCRGLREADVISVHLPLTRETRRLLDRERLSCVKHGAILVNTARGAIIDPEALLEAVREGRIAAAALDVLEEEPPRGGAELELLRHPRVIVTPHIGSQTREAQERIALEAARIALRVLGVNGGGGGDGHA